MLSQSIKVLGPKIWDILPNTYKHMPNLNSFKVALKKWRPVYCPYRIVRFILSMFSFCLKIEIETKVSG